MQLQFPRKLEQEMKIYTFSGCSDGGPAAAKKSTQSEVKSHEILLGNNLNGHETGAVPQSALGNKFSTLQRGASITTAEGARREKMKPNTDKWHFSTLPRKQSETESIETIN